MNTDSLMNLLTALVLILAISLIAWVYFKTWFNSRRFTKSPAIQKNAVESPFKIDELNVDDSDPENAGPTIWRPDAIIVLDEKHRINWANRTAEKWFGFKLERSFREKLTSLVDSKELSDYMESGDFSNLLDLQAPRANKISVRIRIIPYHQNQLLLQARDISQLRALELVRRDFVSNASHELRTPVSVLYGYLEMMKQESSSGISDEWKPAIEQMHEQTARIKQIIEDMLLLSKLEETWTTREHYFIDIESLLESVYENAVILGSSRGHSVSRDIDSGYSLLCNQDEIQSLATNLVTNAIRYTQDKGNIKIEWKANPEGAILSVSDTGIGIAEEDIPRVTERFYRSDPARSRETGGTGLGLAIVNHIVNRHEAELGIQSELGKGSSFSVTFPRERVRKNNDQAGLMLN